MCLLLLEKIESACLILGPHQGDARNFRVYLELFVDLNSYENFRRWSRLCWSF